MTFLAWNITIRKGINKKHVVSCALAIHSWPLHPFISGSLPVCRGTSRSAGGSPGASAENPRMEIKSHSIPDPSSPRQTFVSNLL